MIGKWVAYNEDGLFENWESGDFLFSTKNEIVNQLVASYLDNRKYPTVKRQGSGVYVYDVPDCDCRSVRHTVYIERVTKQNVDKIKEMSEENNNGN